MEKILNKFKKVRKIKDNQYMALCPAHDDKKPSLSIKVDNGKVILYCHAGCEFDKIIKMAGIQKKDLNQSTDSNTTGWSLKQYSKYKGIPIEYLKSAVEAEDDEYYGEKCVLFPYFNTDHEESAIRIRKALNGNDKFRWEKDPELCLYGLWLLKSFKHSFVFLVEGESDCHTLWYKKAPALGVPGANNWKDDRDAQHFKKFKTVYFVHEDDKGGETLLKSLKQSKIVDKIKVISLDKFKDISQMYLSNQILFKKRLKEAMKNACNCNEFVLEESWTVDAILKWINETVKNDIILDGWINKTRHLNNAETDLVVKAVSKKTKVGVRALNKDLKEKQEEWKKNQQEESINGDSEKRQEIIYDKTATIKAVEETLEALIKSDNLYRYGSAYVNIVNKNPESIQEVKRDNRNEGDDFPNRLFISPLTIETLRHKIEKVARFYQYNKDGEKKGILVPQLIIKGLMNTSNDYDRTLTGIIEHPYVNDNFKPITQRGYDPKTGLYCNFPDDLIFDYKKPPSLAFAKKSFQNLCDNVIVDFPFADKIDRVAAVSMFLTALQRKMIAGDSGCPGYEIDAPTQSTGKTTLAQTVCYPIFGRPVPVTGWSSGDDEMGKHLLGILKEGHSCVLFDNLPEGMTLCSNELAKAMTSSTYSKRQLGANKTVTVPSQVLWLFTGNNVQIIGDFNTRILQIRLDAEMEDPDKRRFKRPNIGEWCLKNRMQIIKSCMAIIIAGKNFECSLKPSRFQEWDKFVRFPLYQVTGVDIAEVFDRNKLTDPKIEGQRIFLECWYNLYSIRLISAKEALDDVDVSGLRQVQQSKTEKSKLDLNDAIKDIFSGNLPTSQGFGKWLGTLKGRIIGGLRMDSVKGTGRQNQNRSCWQVTKMTNTAKAKSKTKSTT